MSHTAADELDRLEHEHAHLNRLVGGLRDSAQACLRGEVGATELRGDLEEFVRVAQDELFSHFEREETGLFPFVAEQLPDAAAAVDTLAQGHDRMCGLLVRLERALSEWSEERFVSEFDAVVALFARFDASYTAHAKAEAALLRSVGARLDGAQRRTLARLLAEL